MFKFLFFLLTLWQGIYEISCQNANVENPMMNLYGRSLRPMGYLLGFVDSERKIDAEYFETIGIGAHKLHRRALSWDQARKICNDEQGHLAVIRSDMEEKIILQIMQEMSINEARVGAHDRFEEGEWITVLDEDLAKTGWAKWSTKWPNNPDNRKGVQNCAAVIRDGGGIDDQECTVTKPFVCKISSF